MSTKFIYKQLIFQRAKTLSGPNITSMKPLTT